jgi:hypothetical protein
MTKRRGSCLSNGNGLISLTGKGGVRDETSLIRQAQAEIPSSGVGLTSHLADNKVADADSE